MKSAWEDLDDLDPIPSCNCGAIKSCSCQLLKRILERENQIKLIQLLMGLNSNYESVKENILTMDSFPTINKVLNLLQKVEKQKHLVDSVEIKPESNAYYSHKMPTRSEIGESSSKKTKFSTNDAVDKDFKQCSYCGKKGHTRDECYKLQACSFCDTYGHVKDICYKYKRIELLQQKTAGNKSFKGGKPNFSRKANHVAASEFHTDAEPSPLSSHGAHSDDYVTDLADSITEKVMQNLNQKFSSPSAANASQVMSFAGPFK